MIWLAANIEQTRNDATASFEPKDKKSEDDRENKTSHLVYVLSPLPF